MLPRRLPLSRLAEAVRTLTRVWRPTDVSTKRPADAAARLPSVGVGVDADGGDTDSSLSWVADADGAPDHWLRRIREASLPPAARPGRHQAGRATPDPRRPEYVGPDPGDESRPENPAERHTAKGHAATGHRTSGHPAVLPTDADPPGGVPPAPPAPHGDARRGAPWVGEARSDSPRPEPRVRADAPSNVGADRAADTVAATSSEERPAARLRLRRSDTPPPTPPPTPAPTRGAGDADPRDALTGAPRRIVLRTPDAPSPAAPGGAASRASTAPNAHDGDRAAPATPHTTPPTIPAPASPSGAVRESVGIRAHGARGEVVPGSDAFVSAAAARRGPARDGSPDGSPRPSTADARALAAGAPAATHPWPELSSPRPLTVSGASAESVIREVTRARRLAEEQASV